MSTLWKNPMVYGAKGIVSGASTISLLAGLVNGLMKNVQQEAGKRVAKANLIAQQVPTLGTGPLPSLGDKDYG